MLTANLLGRYTKYFWCTLFSIHKPTVQCSNWYDFQFSYSFLKFPSFGTNIFRNMKVWQLFYMTMMKECVVHCNRPLLSVICACDWMTDLVYLYSRALLGTIILITKYENWQKLELSSPRERQQIWISSTKFDHKEPWYWAILITKYVNWQEQELSSPRERQQIWNSCTKFDHRRIHSLILVQ